MEWYNIISIVVGALGGTAGLIGMYKARSEKTTIDVGNMQSMLDEAHKMYETMKTEKNEVVQDFDEKLDGLEHRLDKTEKRVFDLTSAIYQGYRCSFPPSLQECPVLLEYERSHCQDCVKVHEKGE